MRADWVSECRGTMHTVSSCGFDMGIQCVNGTELFNSYCPACKSYAYYDKKKRAILCC